MAEQTNTGASNAADFQPPTDNPQSNVGGGVQPTTTNGSNVFNQPGINPQAFPKVNSLKVNTNTVASQDSTDSSAGSPGWGALTWVFIAGAVVVTGLILLFRAAKPANVAPKAESLAETPETTSLPLKPKAKSKKKHQPYKRKRGGKKKNRR